jgi:GT2 family glycosyltransferase
MNYSLDGRIPVNNIKVSAIVSTYKSAEFIGQCLEDLVAQTIYQKEELEIIVIDSASPENERDIVQEFQQKYPRIIYQRTTVRETLYQAWNRGIKKARGRYLTNANTDDRRCFNALEILANYLDSNPEISVVYADQLITTIKNETFANTQASRHWNWPNYSYQQMCQGCCVGSQPMWRQSLHAQYGYFQEDFRCAGDYEFWLRIASHGEQMALIPELLGLYYLNLKGLEHGSNNQALREHYQVCQSYQIPHPKIVESEINSQPLNAENLGISLTEDEQERLKLIQAIATKIAPIIVIDAVIFQINQGEIASVWHSILEEWSKLDFGQHLIILDRNKTAPRWANLKYWPTESYDYNWTGRDAGKIQTICDRLQANLFISTYYTTPLSTLTIAMICDRTYPVRPADFKQPEWQEKQYGILFASRYITLFVNTAADLVKFYPQISPAQIDIIDEEIAQEFLDKTTVIFPKMARKISDILLDVINNFKDYQPNRLWRELRKIQENQQTEQAKQVHRDSYIQEIEASLKISTREKIELLNTLQNSQQEIKDISYLSHTRSRIKKKLKIYLGKSKLTSLFNHFFF